MRALPKVPLAGSEHQVARLISGGNPLVANSHYSTEWNVEMRDYFTPERIVQYLHDIQAAGINAIQARGDYHRIMYWLELFKREGGKLHWIAQTASEMADVFENIRIIAAAGAIGIYHHGSQTDNFWLDGRIDKVEDYLKCIRDTGASVGLGTHIPEVIDYAEDKGWDIDFYMACFYNLNRVHRDSAVAKPGASRIEDEAFLPGDPATMCSRIRATDKMCLAFKILGAGRCCESQEDVRKAFQFAFENIKPKDAVVVGMFPRNMDQIALNTAYAMAFGA